MSALEDHIISLLQESDERAVGLIYDKYSRQLYGLVLKMVRDKEAADEVIQLSFIKIWEKSQSYDPDKAKLFTWLYQVTRNTALDYLRKKQRKQLKEIQIQDRDVYPTEDTFDPEDLSDLNNKVNRLEEKFKIVLDAVFYKGLTHVEAAEYLELPLGTLKTRLRNALIELRTVIKGFLILFLSQL